MATDSLTQWQHESGMRIDVPASWERPGTDVPFVALVAVEPPAEPAAFRANVVVTIDSGHTQTFREWQSDVDQVLSGSLVDWHLIDLEEMTIDGHEGVRRLGHHMANDHEPVVMEQWVSLVDGAGFTVTFSVGTFAYDDMADQIADLAAGIQLPAKAVTA